MKELEQRMDVACFYLPLYPVAAASVNEFYGSIHFSMKVTYEVSYAVLESLCYMGFRNIVLIASHADPQHQIAVENAVRKINKRTGSVRSRLWDRSLWECRWRNHRRCKNLKMNMGTIIMQDG